MKLIAIDFDGTLVDSFKIIDVCFTKVFNDFHKEIPIDGFRSFLGPSEEGICLKAFGPIEGEKAFKDYIKYYKEFHKQCIPPIDSRLRDLLYKIKQSGIHLILLTGRSLITCKISLDILGLDPSIFEKIYSGSKYGVNKCDSLAQVLKDYNLKNEDIIYIGDSLRDIESCRNADVKIISVNYYHTANLEKLEANNPNMVCKTIDELVKKVDQIIKDSKK